MLTVSTLIAIASALSFSSISFAQGDAQTAAKPSETDAKVEATHKHKHKKKCGHKAEAHGDHTDYEHTVDGKVHHHRAHGKHFDECEGPESKAPAASTAPAAPAH